MVLGMAGIFGGNDPAAAVSSAVTNTAKPTQPSESSTFAPLLDEAVHTVSRAVQQTRPVGAKTSSSGDTNPSLRLLNGLPPITPASTASTTAKPADVSPTPTVAVLEAALTQSGVNISQLQFSENASVVPYPGGSGYIDDEITVQDGAQTGTYETNLVELSPQVAVTEIQEMMAGIQIGQI